MFTNLLCRSKAILPKNCGHSVHVARLDPKYVKWCLRESRKLCASLPKWNLRKQITFFIWKCSFFSLALKIKGTGRKEVHMVQGNIPLLIKKPAKRLTKWPSDLTFEELNYMLWNSISRKLHKGPLSTGFLGALQKLLFLDPRAW